MLKKIKNIINEWDPIGLISIHAPDDEYLKEIQNIYNYIYENNNIKIDELSLKIYSIFCESFGNEVFTADVKKCNKIAKKIYKTIKSI